MGDVVRIATRRDDWDRWSEPIELVEAHACKHSVRTPDGACVGCGAEVDESAWGRSESSARRHPARSSWTLSRRTRTSSGRVGG